MEDKDVRRSHERWARLRFAVIGHLLACPPADGELGAELQRLSTETWRHPITGAPMSIGFSTIERWYYTAKATSDPVSALRRRLRKDAGQRTAVSPEFAELVRAQHRAHPTWSYKLHRDNVAVLMPAGASFPSYATTRRFMIGDGLLRQERRKGREMKDGERSALERRQGREVRSFEVEYVGGLWHLDFHHASRKVLTAQGEWVKPIALAILDDRSRLACHVQWYLHESADVLIHGLGQAFLKRGLPRALLTDNGSAMTAAETTEGLARLSITHHTTLPYSPYQNGKQEKFWGAVEGRLVAMLEGVPELPSPLLNEATQAWVELEYHRQIHSEIAQAPIDRWINDKSTMRPSPDVEHMRLCFTTEETRRQRLSDGTVSLAGVRYEIPSRFRHVPSLAIRYASWDLSFVWLVDVQTGIALARIWPVDKARNADGVRRTTAAPAITAEPAPTGIAPLLRKLMVEYAATGLPPAYIPKEES